MEKYLFGKMGGEGRVDLIIFDQELWYKCSLVCRGGIYLKKDGPKKRRIHSHLRPEKGSQQTDRRNDDSQVDEALNDENSSIQISSSKMTELKLFKGDAILIKGKKRHETVAVCLVDPKLDDGKIRMNKTIRKNLRVRLGDVVMIKPAGEVPNLTKIHVLPLADTI